VRILIRVLAPLLLLIVGGVFWVNAVLEQELPLPVEGRVVQIAPGQSLGAVLRALHDDELLPYPEVVRRYAHLSGAAPRIQAGEFLIPLGTNARGLLRILSEGRPVMHSFTIVEGWTFREMLRALQAHDAIRVELADASAEQIMAAIGASEPSPEGLFLPDTYHFPRGETDTAFLQRAYREMQTFLATAWAERDPTVAVADPYQALTLASIVEKETGVADERPQIAGVFDRRLKLNMRLETDPTVIYGLGESFDGDLRRRDLDADTPYNTYTRRGLPPTPIALPSPAAILAAMHPAPGDTLYFVAIGDGRHHFSSSYDEHLDAVRRYQLRRR